ncbi:hypothetical protein [Streptomyces rubiginosohelvolus]|uniref:hypothetical protein n=1 Tax=Streptomyces rubiginosohelvolus TaxID=67362 RepID=UPI0035E1D2F5
MGAEAAGATTAGSGTASANLVKVPALGALNQCGGADLPGASNQGGVSMGPGSVVKLLN